MPCRHVAIDERLLRQLYVEERLTAEVIAARLGCASITVFRRLRRFGIAIRPRGPAPLHSVSTSWSPALAYVVGLIATDGNLSSNGRHLSIPSVDRGLLESVRDCLGLGNRIVEHTNRGHRIYRLQWGSRVLYDWLLRIGLTPAKSLSLGPLEVPGILFADFFRGCIDGDGSIITYVDRYNAVKKPTYVYTRLYVSLVSASPRFLEWIRATVHEITGASGNLSVRLAPGRSDIWRLRYAKGESLTVLRWMYYAANVPCLRRKRKIAEPFLVAPGPPLGRRRGRPMVV